jgi:hypothetical protein
MRKKKSRILVEDLTAGGFDRTVVDRATNLFKKLCDLAAENKVGEPETKAVLKQLLATQETTVFAFLSAAHHIAALELKNAEVIGMLGGKPVCYCEECLKEE